MTFLPEADTEQTVLGYSIEHEENTSQYADMSNGKSPERESHDEIVLKNGSKTPLRA